MPRSGADLNREAVMSRQPNKNLMSRMREAATRTGTRASWENWDVETIRTWRVSWSTYSGTDSRPHAICQRALNAGCRPQPKRALRNKSKGKRQKSSPPCISASCLLSFAFCLLSFDFLLARTSVGQESSRRATIHGSSSPSAGFARNPLRIVECGLRNPRSEIRNPKFLLPGDDLPR